MSDSYEVGYVVELKKKHPCGSIQWRILRKGADFKIQCLGCEHVIIIERHKLDKIKKRLVQHEAE